MCIKETLSFGCYLSITTECYGYRKYTSVNTEDAVITKTCHLEYCDFNVSTESTMSKWAE